MDTHGTMRGSRGTLRGADHCRPDRDQPRSVRQTALAVPGGATCGTLKRMPREFGLVPLENLRPASLAIAKFL